MKKPSTCVCVCVHLPALTNEEIQKKDCACMCIVACVCIHLPTFTHEIKKKDQFFFKKSKRNILQSIPHQRKKLKKNGDMDTFQSIPAPYSPAVPLPKMFSFLTRSSHAYVVRGPPEFLFKASEFLFFVFSLVWDAVEGFPCS
jgi:hypothetical protein